MWDLPTEFEIICRDIWALHLSLLPNPPPPEPYLFKHDLNDGSPSQSARGGHGDKPTPAKNIDVDADDNNDKSGSSSSDTEVDDEMVKLLREASETPTSSSSSSSGEEDDDREDKDDKEKTSTASSPPPPPRRTRQKVYHAYEAPVSTISVLMLGCWTLRIPVTYMDFVRAIESYDLVYLDPVRQLPATLVRHLTKHNVHALSPHFAPRPTSVHTLVSRLAKQLYQKYRIFTPEMNVAPLLWRAVRAFEGTPTLYILTKKVAKVLSLPLTLHHSLSPSLERRRAKDPSWHKYDNVPVEVSVACAVVVVLKLAYGLDGISRRPKSRTDPIYALPEMKALLTQISKTEGAEKNSMAGVLSATSDLTALDLNDEQLEDYLDFCEKALFPRADRISDPPIVKEYFPLQGPARDFREDRAQPSFTALPAITTLSPVLAESAETRFPGQGYAVYSSTDILGTVPEDYDVVVQRAASWTGMDERIIHSSSVFIMFSLATIAALTLSVTLGVSGQASTPAELVSSLRTVPTANDRLKLLKDSDFVFNFLNATAAKGAGGDTIGATVANFPVLTNQGLAMTIGNLGELPCLSLYGIVQHADHLSRLPASFFIRTACGMNTPHTHPRATEMLYLVNGTLETGMLDENGARFVYNTINNGSAAVFLKGSIHYQLNWGCEPVQFVAVLNHEDPGVLSVAQRYFGLPPDIVSASLGDFGVQEIEALAEQIPDNIALGTAECLQRCGITRGTQPTSQLQPRISANAFSDTPAPTASAHARRELADDHTTAAASQHVSEVMRVITVTTMPNALNIALVGLVALMASGYVIIALVYARGRGRAQTAQFAAVLPQVAQRYEDRPTEKSVTL
ncbi:hypothetical protein EUX98_g1296 [Antrodiella citrinella]|uniref:Cupin type-1 domain-containing protein n=1 Tax=Antrodiella citrinella TaxID=2447956 RepID=A0A4V3XJG0_9APHY|nr:hypothetical protein EUX98_g1296 [Antrodiella citrinella]